jgi:hypothetical protein
MTIFARYAARALMIGALLFGGGTQQANAAACLTNTTLGDLIALGAGGCTLGDKTFSNFSTTASGGETALPGATVVEFAILILGGTPEFIMTVSDPFTPGATYNLAYSVAITTGANTFASVTGGLLLATPGGSATLTQSFATLGGGSISPNPLEACAISTAACPMSNTASVTGRVTQINTTDAFFVDSSNVTGFSNTFEQQAAVATPEPTTLLALGTSLLWIRLLRGRRYGSRTTLLA